MKAGIKTKLINRKHVKSFSPAPKLQLSADEWKAIESKVTSGKA